MIKLSTSYEKMSERQTKAGNQEHSLTLTRSHSFTLSFTHSRHAEQLLFSCLCSKVTLSVSHSLIQSLLTCWTTLVFMSMFKSHSKFHTLSLTLSHSFNLSFTLSRHADQLLFSCLCSKFAVYRWKCQCFFFDLMGFFLTKLFIYAFFGTTSPPSPVTLPFIELVPS